MEACASDRNPSPYKRNTSPRANLLNRYASPPSQRIINEFSDPRPFLYHNSHPFLHHEPGSPAVTEQSFSIADSHGSVVQVSIDSQYDDPVDHSLKSQDTSVHLIRLGYCLLICSTALLWTSEKFIEIFSFPNVLTLFQYLFSSIITVTFLFVTGRLKGVPHRHISTILIIALSHAASNLAINNSFCQASSGFLLALNVSESLCITLIGSFLSSDFQMVSILLCWSLYGLGLFQCLRHSQSYSLLCMLFGLGGFCCRAVTCIFIKRLFLTVGHELDIVKKIAVISIIGTVASMLGLITDVPRFAVLLNMGEVTLSQDVLNRFMLLVVVNCVLFISTTWLTWRLIKHCDNMNVFVKIITWVSVGNILALSILTEYLMSFDFALGLGIMSLAGLINGHSSKQITVNYSVATSAAAASSSPAKRPLQGR